MKFYNISIQSSDDKFFHRSIPNCIFKSKVERRKSAFISSQIESCKDHSGLFYTLPFQKGYLVNWEAQRQIWDHAFGKEELNVGIFRDSISLVFPLTAILQYYLTI